MEIHPIFFLVLMCLLGLGARRIYEIAHFASRGSFPQPDVEISVSTMRLSGGREEYFVMVRCGKRSTPVGHYTEGFYNRALYQCDELRHVVLGTKKPYILDAQYEDLEGKK
jgi:hypothetical protein